MKIHAFFQGLVGWSLCTLSPLCAESDFVQKLLGMSEEQMRAYWQDGSKHTDVQKITPQSIQALAQEVEQEVENEKLKTALEALKEVVADSESSVESYEKGLSNVKEALADAQKLGLPVPQGNHHHAGVYGKINKELVKATIDLEHKKTALNPKTITLSPSSTCSPVNLITGPTTINAPGHYCLTADVIGTIVITASDVELSLDTHTVSGGVVAIEIDGTVNTVSSVKISGSGTLSGFDAIQIVQAENVTLENLYVTGIFGIFVINSTGITIKNIYADTLTSTFDNTQDVKITSSSFTALSPTNSAITYRENTQDFQVDNCLFEGFLSAFNIFPGDAVQSLKRAAITNCLISNCAGDAVYVQNASEFAIRNTLIDGAARGVALQNAVDFQMQDSQILNTANQGLAIVDAVTNVEVEDCQFLNTGESPVEATHLTNALFSNCTCSTMTPNPHAAMSFTESKGIAVESSVLSAILQDPTTSGTNGIVFHDCRGFSLRDSIVETNARGTENNGGSDVLITGDSFGGVIEGCILKSIQPNVAAFGLLALGANDAIRIENNTIDGAVHGAVILERMHYSLLENNLISGTSEGPGVMLKGAVGVSLFGNTIVGNASDGVYLDNQTINCSLRDNTISKNGTIGLNNQSRSKSNKIYHNFALSNAEKNYSSVSLVADPDFEVGVLENISN